MLELPARDRPDFAVAPGERVSDAIARVVGEDLGWVRSAIADGDLQRVHPSRRRLKRCRALLRALGRNVPDAARDALRETAAALGRIRDRQVRNAIARKLGVHDVPAGAELASTAPETDDGAAFADAVRGLGLAQAALAGFTVTRGRRLLNEALEKAQRRQRQAFRRAKRTRDTEDFHRWRKALQEIASLCDFGGERVRRTARLRHHAGRAVALLGDDHDLALLEAMPGLRSPPDLTARRRTLQRKAIRHGRRLAHLGAPSLRRRAG
ncbi:MAG: CHAD domain-containing protein [Bauldia sp.]|nr:CHAD domain-containing protein [Bauldia sp.]